MKQYCSFLLLLLLFSSCAKHQESTVAFEPIKAFSGRLLVMNPAHRWQFEVDWQGDEAQGDLRITHGLSGRVVYVKWVQQSMTMLDSSQSALWRPLSQASLLEMGVMLPPWTLARVFLGDLPSTMHSQDKHTWQGSWGEAKLRLRWSNSFHKLELLEMKHGRRLVLLFDEVRH